MPIQDRGNVGTADPRRHSELARRIASAIVLGCVALLATWLGGWPFALLWLAAGVAIAVEWIDMTGIKPALPLKAIVCVALVAVAALRQMAAASVRLDVLAVAVAVAAILLVGRSGAERAWAIAGLAYAGVVAWVPAIVRDQPDLGVTAILWMFALVWTTDVAAFFVGRRVGGPKLWPLISPNKTWSGFVGGLLFGTLAGTAVAAVAAGERAALPVLAMIAILSALGSVASQLGDLFESAMKRRFAVKDSGRLIPGHGGVMDRLDGFAAVAMLIGVALAGARLAEMAYAP